MPVTRKLISQSEDSVQILRMDNETRYIVNDCDCWQMLFNGNSAFTSSNQVVKIAAEFDVEDLESIRFVSYLYNSVTGAVDNASTCSFVVSKVIQPGWEETILYSFPGTIQPNNYFFADIATSLLDEDILDGQGTLVIDTVITRLSSTYRERVYINHLGIYDSFLRLKNKVNFLEITKKDE